MEYGTLFIVLASLVGLWMTWGIGANDLANIMSTAMGSRALSVRQAMIIAIIFEVAGAFIGGNEVSATIQNGIIDTASFAHAPQLLIYGMISVLLAGATWITIASILGMPVSITNAIVGSLVGVGAIMLGIHAIHWQKVGYIAISWISSPAIAGVFAFLLFNSIRRWILGVDEPFLAAKKRVPIYLFFVGIILAMMTVLKSLHHFHITLSPLKTFFVLAATVAVVMAIGLLAMRNIFAKTNLERHKQFVYIEGMFSILMALTACAMVFAHGSNDVAIAVGPIAAIMGLVNSGNASQDGMMLNGIMLFGCFGVVLGLFMYGRKVIETVGSAITTLTPSRAFAATLAAASTVVVSTSTGIPVSATQTLVGAVFGVGIARGIDALNLNVIRNIFMSWIITIPAAAGIATIFFFILREIFG